MSPERLDWKVTAPHVQVVEKANEIHYWYFQQKFWQFKYAFQKVHEIKSRMPLSLVLKSLNINFSQSHGRLRLISSTEHNKRKYLNKIKANASLFPNQWARS